MPFYKFTQTEEYIEKGSKILERLELELRLKSLIEEQNRLNLEIQYLKEANDCNDPTDERYIYNLNYEKVKCIFEMGGETLCMEESEVEDYNNYNQLYKIKCSKNHPVYEMTLSEYMDNSDLHKCKYCRRFGYNVGVFPYNRRYI